MRVSVSVLVLCALCALTLGEWTLVQNDYETIAMATSFSNATGGWVTGGTASLDPLFLYTTDGGKTFTNMGMQNTSLGAFLSIRVAGNTWGVAGGFGFFGLPCGAYTPDGANWYNMEERGISLVCALQGASAVNDGRTGVLIGVWSHSRDWNGDGIKITTDKGKRWSQINSDTGDVPVRYGSFLSKDLGFVTAGIWPSDTDSFVEYDEHNNPLKIHLNQRVSFDLTRRQYTIDTKPRAAEVTGYAGLIAKVTNEGNDWQIMVNETNSGFYFEEISCVDNNNCWAVGQGIDNTGNATGVIYHTSNGWSTYDIQMNTPGVDMECIAMLTSTYGWAAGALVSGDVSGSFDGYFYYTTDGINWTFDSQLKNFFPMDLSVTDQSHAFSAGISPIGLSSFASYTSA